MTRKKAEPEPAPPEEPKAPLRTPRHIRFPCMTFKQGKHTLLLFIASAKALWDIVKINKREEDKDEGYQRVLSPARADKMAQFIDAGNVLPGSVLISFDDDTKLNKDRDAIVIPNRADAGWVIDGQHRLAGASRSEKDITLPVVAFIGLSIDEQINCFVTINREQVGVPSSLYYELLKYLGSKSEAEVTKERAADLAQKLKTDEGSPFFGKIVVTIAPKRGELSLTNFVRKLAPLMKRDGRLTYYNDEDRQGIINNYYLALQQVFPSEYKRGDSIFFKTLGFGALMNVLPTFMDLCIQNYHGFRVEDAVALFNEIDYFDFGVWHQRGTGNAAEIAAGEDLRTEFRRAFEGDKNRTTIKLK